MASKKKKAGAEALERLTDTSRARADAMGQLRGQMRTAAKVAIGAVVVVWLLAVGFWSGLDTTIPLWIAASLTIGLAVAAFMVRRNLGRSEEIGELLSGEELSDEERARRMAKLQDKVKEGDAGAILAKAQLEMQDNPEQALRTLEAADLEKANKLLANQIRAMRAMLHLNQGEVQAARTLADAVDLSKAPDAKTRAHLSGVVAEAWARSNNPIEASELLDKYDFESADLGEVKMQLVRARVFACVHKNDLNGMKRGLKQMEEVTPQLLALFVAGKRIHPLLQQEARKRLEKSGLVPRPKIQAARR